MAYYNSRFLCSIALEYVTFCAVRPSFVQYIRTLRGITTFCTLRLTVHSIFFFLFSGYLRILYSNTKIQRHAIILRIKRYIICHQHLHLTIVISILLSLILLLLLLHNIPLDVIRFVSTNKKTSEI